MMYYIHAFIFALTYPLRAILNQPSRIFSPIRWLVRLSLPTKVAILTFFFWLICAISVFVLHYSDPDRAGWDFFKTWWWVIALLMIVIPFVVYFTLKLWLETDVSPFPDIDHAWKAGLAELQRQGIDLMHTPLFLVIGSGGENQEKGLFAASRLNYNVEDVPRGTAALHWYADADGVYLVCTQAGRLSHVATAGRRVSEEESVGPGLIRPQERSETVRGTFVAGDGVPASQDPGPRPAPSSPMASSNIRGTMEIPGAGAWMPEATPTKERRPVKMEPREAAEQDRRLEYVCRLIWRQRQPLCPINGVLTLLPFSLLQRSRPDAYEVQGATQKDVATLARMLKLRCPTTALVVGLEDEPGFQELVRRVGRDRCAGQRFGRGYSLTNPPLAERLRVLAARACGSFEDWVYALYAEPGSLSRTGNTRLYSMLVKIRGTVQTRLADVLAEGFGTADGQSQPAEGPFFGGCYFGAAGETEDRQAFVRGVFEKLPEQQEEVEWTQTALVDEQRLQHIGQSVLALGTALLLGLGGMIGYYYYHR